MSLIDHAGAGNVNDVRRLCKVEDVNATNEVGDTALHAACYGGHTATVRILLDSPNLQVDKHNGGWTPLHIACEHGFHTTAELLLRQGKSNPNAQGGGKQTPLHLACRQGHVQAVKALLHHPDIDVNARTVYNRTKMDGSEAPLHLAVAAGHHNIVDALLQHKDIDANATTGLGYSALHIICRNNHPTVGDLFIWYWENFKDRNIDLSPEVCGWTPLHMACEAGKVDCVKLFSGKGSKINKQNDHGNTGLHLACQNGSIGAITMLLKNPHLDVSLINQNGFTVLHTATENNYVDVVNLLVSKTDVDINAASASGETALHLAALNGSQHIMNALLKQGAAVNAKNNVGNTPLHISTARGSLSCMLMLLRSRVIDPNVLNYGFAPMSATYRNPTFPAVETNNPTARMEDELLHDGRTPIHVACEHGQILALKTLLQFSDVDVLARTRNGVTALHIACRKGDVKAVDTMLTIPEVDVNARDSVGNTPLMDACRCGHKKTVNRLLQVETLEINAVNTQYFAPAGMTHTAALRQSGSALHLACEFEHESIIRALLRHGQIDINTPTPFGGATPLHICAEKNLIGIIERLLMLPELDVGARRDDGLTAYDIARQLRHTEIAILLQPGNEDLVLNFETRDPHVPIVLRYYPAVGSPNPQSVCIIGSFNGWNANLGARLHQLEDKYLGCVFCIVLLMPIGDNKIQFIVDGQPAIDTKLTPAVSPLGHGCNIFAVSAPNRNVNRGLSTYLHVQAYAAGGARKIDSAPVPYHKYGDVSAEVPLRTAKWFKSYTPREYEKTDADGSRIESGTPEKYQLNSSFAERRGGEVLLGAEIKWLDDLKGHRDNVAVVHSVRRNGPADWAGILPEDIVVKINGHDINSKDDLKVELARHSPGEQITVYIIRNDLEVRKLVKLGDASKRTKRPPRTVSSANVANFDGSSVHYPSTEYGDKIVDTLGDARLYEDTPKSLL